MDGVGLAADEAFWSTWATTTKVAPGIAREAGLGKVPAADEQAAAAARARLAEAGVEVDADGRVAFSQTQRDLYAASPSNQDLPVTGNSLMIGPTAEDNEELAVTGLPRKFASRIHRHVEALAAAALWNNAGDETRRIMLSAGGKGSGADWIAVPTTWHEWWNESEFVAATRFFEDAGGHPLPPCEQVYRGTVWTPHAWYCHPLPSLSVRPSTSEGTHTAMKRMLAGELRRLHFETDVERVVPELSSPESDAIMDLVTFPPDNFSRFLVDVTVRTPHATRCSQASVRPGEAASLGASDKRERYGETVLALPLETYGRLGDEAESTLWTLAQAAERAGGNGTASRIHPSWKTKLQRVVLRAVADVALLAMNGCRPEGGSAEWG